MPQDVFSRFLRMHGHPFRIERDGTIIAELDGLENHDSLTSRAFVGFMPNSDIKVGDWLINGQNERYYVFDTKTSYLHGKASSLDCFYKSQSEYSQETTNSAVVFNIGTATGSIIGTQGIAELTFSAASIDQMRRKAEADGGPDKEDSQKIISLLEMLVDEQIPPSKGLFSKFSSVMERHSWITNALASALVSWLTSVPH